MEAVGEVDGEGREEVMSDVKYSALDPGIREVVRLLRGWGFDTTDSGDGVTKPLDFEGVLRIPHVHCVHDLADDVFEAARFMREHLLALGLTDEHFQVQVLFDPCPGNDGLTISLFNLNDETLATVKP
jgi:hypothetical protein